MDRRDHNYEGWPQHQQVDSIGIKSGEHALDMAKTIQQNDTVPRRPHDHVIVAVGPADVKPESSSMVSSTRQGDCCDQYTLNKFYK